MMENKQEELKSAIDVLKKHGWYDPNVSAGNYRIPMPYVLRFMQEHTSDLQKQLKEKEEEIEMLKAENEKLRLNKTDYDISLEEENGHDRNLGL